MEVVLTSAKKVQIFADIFRNLKNILTDVNISFSEIGLYIQGMDVTHALLVELKIKKEWFDNYNVTKNITMGINCETFFKILNCLKDDQNIKLNFDEDDDKLSISFSEGESISKDFELNLMEIDAELMDIPEKEYQMDICLKSQEFTDLIKELTIFNDIAGVTAKIIVSPIKAKGCFIISGICCIIFIESFVDKLEYFQMVRLKK